MYKYVKRFFDAASAVVLLVLTSPIFVSIAAILFFVNKGSVFFFQDRPGLREKKIRIMKFKSMTDELDSNGHLLPNEQRLTSFGKFIRKTSLDELPQLVNVLRGDLSLIGPRPLLFKYLPLYSPEQRRRHEVKPGISGWAQVNGRNSISWHEKFTLDIYYVDHISFWFDIKIFWLTIAKILKREGVNRSEVVSMPPFDGTN